MRKGPGGLPGSVGGNWPEHRKTANEVEEALESAPTADGAARLREVTQQLSAPEVDGPGLLAALLERRVVALRLVELVIEEGRTAEALSWCAKLLERQPDYRHGLMFKSLIEVDSGDGQAALATCDAMVTAYPEDPDAYLHRGTIRLAALVAAPKMPAGPAEERRLALDDFDVAARLAPERAEAHLARGRALAQLGELDDALAAYDQGLACDPSLIAGYLERAELRLRRSEHEHAIHDCAVVIGKLSEDRASDAELLAEAHLVRARSMIQLGALDGAADDYAEAVRLDPELVEASLERAQLHNQQREHFAALRAFEEVLQLDPDNVVAYMGKADALLALGEDRMASSAYWQATERDPGNARAHLGRAVARLSIGTRERWRRQFDTVPMRLYGAVEEGELAVQLDPDDPWTHVELGRALRAAVAYDEAVSQFDAAQARAGDDTTLLAVLLGDKAETLRLWGELASDSAKLQRALDILEDATQLNATQGDQAWLHRISGATLIQFRAFEGALAAFGKALMIDPTSAWSHFGKGKVLLLLGRHKEAAITFGQMLTLSAAESLQALWAETGLLLARRPWLLEAEEPELANELPLADPKQLLDRADVFAALWAEQLAEHDRDAAVRVMPTSANAALRADATLALAWSHLRHERPGSSDSGRSGRLMRALDLGRQALKLAGERPFRGSCHEALGQAHAELGNTTEAVSHFQEALAVEPRNLRLRLRLQHATTRQ